MTKATKKMSRKQIYLHDMRQEKMQFDYAKADHHDVMVRRAPPSTVVMACHGCKHLDTMVRLRPDLQPKCDHHDVMVRPALKLHVVLHDPPTACPTWSASNVPPVQPNGPTLPTT